jgi:hypothetical protein
MLADGGGKEIWSPLVSLDKVLAMIRRWSTREWPQGRVRRYRIWKGQAGARTQTEDSTEYEISWEGQLGELALGKVQQEPGK